MSGTDVAGAGELDVEARAALRRLVLTLSDSKRILGIRYSDWLLGSPSVETAIAVSAMAQDEWGHGRLLYAMLKDFGVDPMEVEHERDAGAYTSIDVLDREFDDWAAVVAAIVVADGALAVALEGFGEGCYEPARGRVPKMLSEEGFHADMGRAWFQRLAGAKGEGGRRLRAAVEAFLPRTLAWLAPDDAPHRILADRGIVPSAEALRDRFEERVEPILGAVEVDPAALEAERSGWDEGRARGPGAPDPDAVERARGDRNRHLFVE